MGAGGAVRRFQADAGFDGDDVDGIPGPMTRAALHAHLGRLPPLSFRRPTPPDGIATDIAEIRKLIAEADRRLARIAVA